MVRPVLIKSCLLIILLCGCTSSTTPTYIQENIDTAVKDVCKKEYRIDVVTKLVGSTLWIYLPLEDIFEKSEKPEKYVERFEIKDNREDFQGGTLDLEYLIRPIADQEKTNELKYNKSALDKVNDVWKVVRRVLFSMERLKGNEPQFFVMVTADIKNGFEIKEISYIEDLKKVSYEFISWGEYQHRTIQDTAISPAIVGDKEGLHLDYQDITMQNFIAAQIRQRIKLKFQKPEVDKSADIDKEILKIVVYTLKTYSFKDFSSVELNNLLTNNKIILNQAAVWARPTE